MEMTEPSWPLSWDFCAWAACFSHGLGGRHPDCSWPADFGAEGHSGRIQKLGWLPSAVSVQESQEPDGNPPVRAIIQENRFVIFGADGLEPVDWPATVEGGEGRERRHHRCPQQGAASGFRWVNRGDSWNHVLAKKSARCWATNGGFTMGIRWPAFGMETSSTGAFA